MNSYLVQVQPVAVYKIMANGRAGSLGATSIHPSFFSEVKRQLFIMKVVSENAVN